MPSNRKSKKGNHPPPKSPPSSNQREATTSQSNQAQNETVDEQLPRSGTEPAEGSAVASGAPTLTTRIASLANLSAVDYELVAGILLAGTTTLMLAAGAAEVRRFLEFDIEDAYTTPERRAALVPVLETIRTSQMRQVSISSLAFDPEELAQILVRIVSTSGSDRIIAAVYPAVIIFCGRLYKIPPAVNPTTASSNNPDINPTTADTGTSGAVDPQNRRTESVEMTSNRSPYAGIIARTGTPLFARIAHSIGADYLATIGMILNEEMMRDLERFMPLSAIFELVQCVGYVLMTDILVRTRSRRLALASVLEEIARSTHVHHETDETIRVESPQPEASTSQLTQLPTSSSADSQLSQGADSTRTTLGPFEQSGFSQATQAREVPYGSVAGTSSASNAAESVTQPLTDCTNTRPDLDYHRNRPDGSDS